MNDRDTSKDTMDHSPEPVIGRVNGWRKMIVLAIMLSALSILLSAGLFYLVLHEADVRRSQNCVLFVAEAKNDERERVSTRRQLDDTLTYLESLSDRERRQALNVAIENNLPVLREEVRLSVAEAEDSVPPDYCGRGN